MDVSLALGISTELVEISAWRSYNFLLGYIILCARICESADAVSVPTPKATSSSRNTQINKGEKKTSTRAIPIKLKQEDESHKPVSHLCQSYI